MEKSQFDGNACEMEHAWHYCYLLLTSSYLFFSITSRISEIQSRFSREWNVKWKSFILLLFLLFILFYLFFFFLFLYEELSYIIPTQLILGLQMDLLSYYYLLSLV